MFIKYLRTFFEYKKYSKMLDRIYQDEDVIRKMSFLVGAQFRKDDIGRLYAVINPAIRDGKYNEEQALEWKEDGLNNEEYIKGWVIKYLSMIQNFIQINNLFELLTYRIEKLDEYGNYLFVIQPICLDYLLKNLKKAVFFYGITILIVIFIILYIVIKLI